LTAIGKIDTKHGILGTIVRKRTLIVPLDELTPAKKSSANEVLNDYGEWFMEDYYEGEAHYVKR
jgi:hypothetical protein